MLTEQMVNITYNYTGDLGEGRKNEISIRPEVMAMDTYDIRPSVDGNVVHSERNEEQNNADQVYRSRFDNDNESSFNTILRVRGYIRLRDAFLNKPNPQRNGH